MKRALRRPFLSCNENRQMKSIYALGLSSVVLLSACNSQQSSVPDPSPAQVQAAEMAYQDLRDAKFDEFLVQLTPELQQQFQDNPKVMKKFSHSIPKGDYKSKTLMLKNFNEQISKGSEYKVSYEIAYPGNLVQYDVSFDKPNGSSKIQNFNIRVFGE